MRGEKEGKKRKEEREKERKDEYLAVTTKVPDSNTAISTSSDELRDITFNPHMGDCRRRRGSIS